MATNTPRPLTDEIRARGQVPVPPPPPPMGNASETIRDLRAANSELYVQLRQWKERHKRLSEACDIFEKNSANAVVMWEALRAIQSQCAGHSDEFSQNVWQLATKALTTADSPKA